MNNSDERVTAIGRNANYHNYRSDMDRQYELEQARHQGGQDAYRMITLVSLCIIILLSILLVGDFLIEYGRESATTQMQTFSNPIYQADAIPTSTVPVSAIEEGTTINKPGKP